MPAQVVLVHPDQETVGRLAAALATSRRTVQAYTDPLLALDALEHASTIELLVTCVRFPAGRSNGRALALMARQKRPGIRFLFLCAPEDHRYIADLGPCAPLPVDVPGIAGSVEQLLHNTSGQGGESAEMTTG